MKRGTVVIGLFVLVIIGVIGFGLYQRNQPPIEITIAVDPLGQEWLTQAVSQFNDANVRINSTRPVHINITSVSDMDVWTGNGTANWTAQAHPDAWIPSASLSVAYARGRSSVNQMQILAGYESLARTPLIWGGYAQHADEFIEGGGFDWSQVHAAAAAENWGTFAGSSANTDFVQLAFALPDQSINGLAVLLSGAAAHADTAILTQQQIGQDFQNWMTPIIDSVASFATIGSNVPVFVARVGPSAVDFALAPESQWLLQTAALQRAGDFRFSYPVFTFMFDFPLAVWADAPDDVESAARAFGDWLLRSEQQNQLPTYGLRPATGEPAQNATLFVDAQSFGIILSPTFGPEIEPPSYNDVLSLFQWFDHNQS